MCPDVSTFNKLFDYLEDKALEKDKSDIYKCISCIVTKLFSEFCNAVANKPKTKERDQNLETIAIILLIEFNNPKDNIRKNADRFLSCLVGIFPHLLWSKAVLFGMLNALQTLSLSVDDEDTQEVKVHTYYNQSPFKIWKSNGSKIVLDFWRTRKNYWNECLLIYYLA